MEWSGKKGMVDGKEGGFDGWMGRFRRAVNWN